MQTERVKQIAAALGVSDGMVRDLEKQGHTATATGILSWRVVELDDEALRRLAKRHQRKASDAEWESSNGRWWQEAAEAYQGPVEDAIEFLDSIRLVWSRDTPTDVAREAVLHALQRARDYTPEAR